MKVRLTLNGTPFGRTMHKDIAKLYIEQTKYIVTGLHYELVNKCRR